MITVTAPASKSLTHRAIIASALACGSSTVRGALESKDIERTIAVLAAMGAKIERRERGVYGIDGVCGLPAGGSTEAVGLDVGESGTTCRLLTAVAAAGEGMFKVFGEGRMHDRPIGDLVAALETQGTEISWLGAPGNPPLLMKASRLSGGEVGVSIAESSQYLSGLLFAAPLARRTTVLTLLGDKAVSWPYVGLTLQVMADFGVTVKVESMGDAGFVEVDPRTIMEAVPGRIRLTVIPQSYTAKDSTVEGDFSNASYFLAAGALGPNPVRIENLNPDSAQGDKAILDILALMGAEIVWDGRAAIASPGRLKGVEVDMGACPDLVPTIAVVAAFADGPTTIRNVAHLRIKESDRMAGPANELAKIGAKFALGEDGLTIFPGPAPKPGTRLAFRTYDDHRMAMSLSLLSLRGIEVELDNPGCTAKSFPGFFDEWAKVALP